MVFGGFAFFSRPGARLNHAFLRLNLGSIRTAPSHQRVVEPKRSICSLAGENMVAYFSTRLAPPQQRVGESMRLSSSICARFVAGNANLQPLTAQATKGLPQCLDFCKRAGESKRFSSYVCSRFVVSRQLLIGQATTGQPQYLNFSKRFCTSSRSTNGNPLRAEPANTFKSWTSFLICASAVLGGMALMFPSNSEDEELDAGAVSIQKPGDGVRDIARNLVNIFKVEGGDDLVKSSYNMYLMNWSCGFLKSISARNGADELAEAIMEVVCEDSSSSSSLKDKPASLHGS